MNKRDQTAALHLFFDELPLFSKKLVLEIIIIIFNQYVRVKVDNRCCLLGLPRNQLSFGIYIYMYLIEEVVFYELKNMFRYNFFFIPK